MIRLKYRIPAIVIGALFVTAGILKALDPAAFALDIQNYRILPWTWGAALALYLPWLEIFCGAALITRLAYRGALAITSALLLAFIIAYTSTRLRGLDVACGCFGHGVHRGYWPFLLGDTAMLAVTLWLLRVDFRPISPVIKSAKN